MSRCKPDDPAAVLGRTRFPSSVVDAGGQRALKSGKANVKLGERVQKGAWKGLPIFSLTLEERKTCPRSCVEWLTCYGNNMPWATRFNAGEALERQIESDLIELSAKHPNGFVVRLHVLGDFYSVEYVRFWERMLRLHPALRIFGYTAHDPFAGAIGYEVWRLRESNWRRFAVRTSNGGRSTGPNTRTIFRGLRLDPSQDVAKGEEVKCPAQMRVSESCATCTLCWSAPDRTIIFERH
jgi:hypothetical protein